VYKLVGPILVKQSVDEAKVDVERRLEFIGGEMWVLPPIPPPLQLHRRHQRLFLWHTDYALQCRGLGRGLRIPARRVAAAWSYAGVHLAGELCGGCTRTPFNSNPPRNPTEPHSPSVFLNSTRSEKRIKDHQEQMEVLRKSIAALGAAKSG
jgi:hypothetical protein